MSDIIRVGVTGSRYYGRTGRVREAAADAERAYGFPWPRLLLVHGRCDPRIPDAFRTRVPWDDAELLPPGERMGLLGGDWLMAQAAAERGWDIEAHPADWSRGKRAGPERNDRMISRGASLWIALTELCDLPGCDLRRGAHFTHGTDHCARAAELAGIKVWRYPA